MIFVLTGSGKGKTTCAVGMGLRAVGAGKRVLMVQFLKIGESSEIKAIEKIDGFDSKSFGRKGFFLPKAVLAQKPELAKKAVRPMSAEDTELAKQGFEFAKNAAESGKYNVLILDEINIALYFGLFNRASVLEFLKQYGKESNVGSRAGKLDIILTGRYCPEEIIALADLVTDFGELKHYYGFGQSAKKGIEL